MHLSFSWSGFLRNTLCNKELNANCVKRRCGVRHVREKSKVYSVTQITMWAMTLGPKGRQCGTHTELQLSHPRCTDFGYLSTNPLSGEPIEVLQEGCWASALSAATQQMRVGCGAQRKPSWKEMKVLAVRMLWKDQCPGNTGSCPPVTASATVHANSWPANLSNIREMSRWYFLIRRKINSAQIFLKQDRYYLSSGAFSRISHCSNIYITDPNIIAECLCNISLPALEMSHA